MNSRSLWASRRVRGAGARGTRRRTTAGVAILAVAAMALSACTTGSSGGNDAGGSTPSSGSQASGSSAAGGSPGESGGSSATPSNSESGSAGSGSGGTGKVSDDTFTIGIGVDLDTLDPALQTTTTVQNVIDYGLQTLLTFDKDGKIQPLLATDWKTTDDGKALVLDLRKDVTFHDGTPFNAKAVKFSLERLIDPDIKVQIGAAYQVITSVDVLDTYKVKINMKRVDPNLLPNLAVTVASIISPASQDKDGNTYDNIVHPVGTGPYEFVEFDKSQKAVYKRYDDYWGDKPYYGKVVFKIIPEANSREAGLRSGQLDMIMNPPVTDLDSLSSADGISVLKAPSDRTIFIAFNNTHKPFTNQKVRQAFNYAIDKKAIIKNVLFGAVDQMDSPFATSIGGYCKAGTYDYDPDKAKQLLKESGVGDISVTFGTPTGRYLQDKQAVEAMAGYLRKVGVKVKVQTTDWPSYITAMQDKNGPYDLHLLGWAPGALDAPTQMEMLDKESWAPNGLNNSFYSDPEVEKMFAEAQTETDDAARNKTYCDIQKKIWDDAPWIFLWSQTLILAYQSDIAGISYQPNEKFETIGAHPKG